MEIELKEIPIKAVFNGYVNNNEEGVVAYGGKLNVRPKYQREFIYKDQQRNSVIETVKKDFYSMSCTGLKTKMILLRFWTGNKEQ